MIEQKLAIEFIRKISDYTECNVNIINERGIIIASRDQDRVGTFHEAAFSMIENRKDIMRIYGDDNYLGVKKGINMLLLDNGRPTGVLGVTGDPEKLHEIVMVIKIALELFLQFEREQSRKTSIEDRRERLFDALFVAGNNRPEKLEDLAELANFSPRIIRVPVLLAFNDEVDRPLTTQKLDELLQPQDMRWVVDKGHVLVCRALQGKASGVLSTWRDSVTDFLNMLQPEVAYSEALVGTLQNRLHYYKDGLNCCEWLERRKGSKEKIVFFYDHLSEYFQDLVSTKELQAIWNVYSYLLDEEEKEIILENIASLGKNNYNLASTAKELFIHKNSMAYRMNKIKNLLAVNPIQSASDRFFVENLHQYLKRIDRRSR